MRIAEARTQIVNAYSALVGVTMSPSMEIHHDLVGAVKYGRRNAKEVATSMIKAHGEMCSAAFRNQ